MRFGFLISSHGAPHLDWGAKYANTDGAVNVKRTLVTVP